MNKNWKRKVNNDLWEQLDMLATARNIKWKWIKGHSGHPENEEANRIAGLQSGVIGRADYSDLTIEGLTHLDEHGQVRMVDVGNKSISSRSAVAKAFVRMESGIIRMILDGEIPKGDVLACARLAGIMAAKQTSSLIPLCHPIELNQVKIDLDCDELRHGIVVRATVSTNARTGVEMEALTAVTISSLTIYDMCKSLDKSISIEEIILISKRGGKSGDYQRDE
jgi:cyclic pyranopterin phosphate synthase